MSITPTTPITREEAKRLRELSRANFEAADQAERESHFAFSRSLRLRGEEHLRQSVAILKRLGDAIGTNDLESAATLLGLALIMVVTYGVALVVR